MRIPSEPAPRPRQRRRGLWIALAIAIVIFLLVVVQALAGFYANFLWFHYSGVGGVWGTVTSTKVELGVIFVALAFVLFWGCLYLVDKVAPRALFMAPDNEFVRRYQSAVGPHAVALRTLVALVVALLVGTGASGQWQHWILFEHAVPFAVKDPIFHRDVSFFVYRLPFLSFLVDWVFVALIVAFVLTAVSYFLNGAIRLQGVPRVEPRALAHLSLLLALMALVRAWAYYVVDRYALEFSSSGVVNGAGYTDEHVRLPAMTLLAVISLVAFLMLTFNVYQRTLVLPAVAVGLWAFLAIVIGLIFPAAVQVFRVNPAQSTLELPYIQRNIAATRFAMGLNNVIGPRAFPANQDLTPGVLAKYRSTLDAAQVWDPTISAPTFQKLQRVKSYYRVTNLAIDRYNINGTLTPVVVGVRALNSQGVINQSWVNTHLIYTHGYGAIVAPANTATSIGTPQFLLGDVPPSTSDPKLTLAQPAVYFAPGDSQYVIVNTSQKEFDYQQNGGNTVASHYAGRGGIPISSFLSRLAFAIKLRDFNLLISGDIRAKSRLIYVPDVRALVQKAFPFLQVDANPYPVIVGGHLDWMVDAYTTTDYYPYGQQASTGALAGGSGLQGRYNYVRDAVKVVVNAYSGQLQAYVIDPGDPLIRSYERAFPGLFHPLAAMPKTLLSHLRYPQDLLTVQAAMYGRYHVTVPSDFYSQSNAWGLATTSTPNASASTTFSPIYQLLQLPGESSPSFQLLEPLSPFSQGDQGNLQILSALLTADSSANDYGELEAFATPSNRSIDGPGLANADVKSNTAFSAELTLLGGQNGGSKASLGTTMVLPIADSLLYVRPLYVSSSETSYPQLKEVVIVYGKQVSFAPTLDEALAKVFGSSGGTGGSTGVPGTVGTLPTEVSTLISKAMSDYKAAQTALGKGDLGGYQQDVTAAAAAVAEADKLLRAANPVLPKTSTKSGTKGTTAAHHSKLFLPKVSTPTTPASALGARVRSSAGRAAA